ncbi:hypothetical protein SAMN02745227_01772 [Anaerobranca californiensis DSM 14826]|jgi:predicted MPP superfamily phosphohydrolase|uniref:Calcineurin-like phosphoesterase domain-containing protein n=1 Tax=Anaerobranca californiensis DSM 14826 TaxID=1120989 RepID=A0A1M6QJP4_9FIRM|nr:metallophosphoesterase [Anaerobranca californiensis]SHK20340.1 hypothetical protein SAMN02745227_01772 [Anaerobranca californiensis DSM 14826]
MRPYFYLALTVFLSIYYSLVYYIGTRFYKILNHWLPKLNPLVYWITLFLVASIYILVRIFNSYIPYKIAKVFVKIGAYWLGLMFYLLIIFFLLDFIILLLKLGGIVDKSVIDTYWYLKLTGIISFLLIAVVLIYGTIMAKYPRVVEYDITLPKGKGQLSELTAVLVSDIHLGKIIDNQRLTKMVNLIKEIDPDIILIAGDIVDEDVGPFTREKMYETFGILNPPYGIFACLGNHDYIGGQVEEVKSYLKKSGVQVLIDQYVKIQESFYIAGRQDRTGARISGPPRKPLNQWLIGIDEGIPVILLDHQPNDLEEAANFGVSLLLAGHTHRGQMYPNHFITSLIYENDYGYSKKEKMHIIVSSGYGTWGPPIRIGTRGEIVKINIKFD